MVALGLTLSGLAPTPLLPRMRMPIVMSDVEASASSSSGAGPPVASGWETRAMPSYDYKLDYYKDLLSGMEQCRADNPEVLPVLKELEKFDFFSYFAVDMLSSCSYMPTEELPCDLDACEIDPVDDMPEGMVARDENEYEFEIDGWARWDQPSDFTEYYDLREIAEKNTGYDGSRVWRFIHQKICFQREVQDPDNGWKRDFNRAISGMHAAVACHIVEDLGVETDEGLAQYRRRLRDEPGVVANLYFAYMLTLCALLDCRERLVACNYLGEGEGVRPLMRQLVDAPLLSARPVQRAAESLREHARSDNAQVWKMRLRTRDLLRIMNCVQCNNCKLHGKVMSMGIGSTLAVLLGDDGKGGDATKLDRVELGALVATCAKLGRACDTVERFRAADEAASSE